MIVPIKKVLLASTRTQQHGVFHRKLTAEEQHDHHEADNERDEEFDAKTAIADDGEAIEQRAEAERREHHRRDIEPGMRMLCGDAIHGEGRNERHDRRKGGYHIEHDVPIGSIDDHTSSRGANSRPKAITMPKSPIAKPRRSIGNVSMSTLMTMGMRTPAPTA